jgi:polar amino acid transport system substrate-binding protein
MRHPGAERILRSLCILGALLAGLWLFPLTASAQTPAADCASAADALARVKCTGVLRVGVRTGYPPYASGAGETLQGFEIELARQLALRLRVAPEFTIVTPANRIALLGEGKIDLVLATMGHTLQRDGEALFVRPHYQLSQTVVIGRRALGRVDMNTLRGKTVCVTLGNNTNAELSAAGARLLLFDKAPRLVDELSLGGCSLVAQDDAFFAVHLSRPAFAAANEVKFGFAPLPWGVAVSRRDGQSLADALAIVLRQMHAETTMESLARKYGVYSRFMADQQELWNTPKCAADTGLEDPGCLIPPRDNRLPRTAFATAVDNMEAGVKQATGVKVTLAMLKSQIAFDIFIGGIVFSLVLVAGAVAATWGTAHVFGAALSSRHAYLRWPMRCLLWVMQSTPLMLLMILASVLVSAFGPVSPASALIGAVIVLGLFNGSNAGQAIAEAMATLRLQHPDHPVPLSAAVHSSSSQMVAFVVNATRGSPAASVMGVPELLSALTDIASFSSERVTTYTLLLAFYMAVIALVVRLGHWWQARMAMRQVLHA